MVSNPVILNKIRTVVFSNTEPSITAGILWGRKDEDNNFSFYAFTDGRWEKVKSQTGPGGEITIQLGDDVYHSIDGTVFLPAYPTALPASDVYEWAKESSKPSYAYSEIAETPTLATVATSGSYNDLTNKPTIPDAQIQSDWNQTIDTAKDYIKNKPTSLPASDVYDWAKAVSKPTYAYSEITNTPAIPVALSDLSDDSAHRLVTDTKISNWDGVYGVVPSAAYNVGNELADKSFVNSSIATATADYKNNYNLVNDLLLTTSATHSDIQTALATKISGADNNDYCFVEIPTEDATPTQIARVERYKYNGTSWSYEYTLNNSSFTANQWATINSGLVAASKTKLDNIASGAQVNVIESISINGTTQTITGKNVDLPAYPTTLPASDVYEWAKASTKPSYAYSEITGTPNLATVATSGSYNDLTNKPTIPPAMVVLSYGSSTWAEFLAAFQSNAIVYCKASSNSNPATGNQGRMAFMAFVTINNGTPTSVEFQYYRSVTTHSATQQGDQVFIYKLESNGTWSVTTREAYTKVVAGTNMSSSYSNGTITLSATDTNTHRPIQVGGTQILGDNTTALNLVAGTNISLSNSEGSVTIGMNSDAMDMGVETFSGTTLSVAVGKYYRATESVETLAITLPAVTDTTKTKSIILNFATGSTPNITFTSADSKTISYYSNYSIEASKEYEINIVFNGAKWIIASAEIANA